MYSISKLVADAAGNVVALDWRYSNEDGSLGNRWVLLQPYGPTALEDVTEAIAIEWLVAQLPNTEEDFIAQLRKDAERRLYEAELADYAVSDVSPTRINEEAPETV